jgi:uncharacterized protein
MLDRILTTFTLSSLLTTALVLPSFNQSIAQTPQQSSATTQPAKPISAEKRALIKELLEITEARKNLIESIDSMIRSDLSEMVSTVLKKAPDLGSNKPEAEDKLMTIVTKMATKYRDRVLKEVDINQLVEQIAFPIYDKYFTETEMREIVGFYKSATGKKAFGLTSQIFGDSISRTGEILLPKMSQIMKEVIDEGLLNVLPSKK